MSKQVLFTILVACAILPGVHAQESEDQFPFDILPAVDPAELQQLAALDDDAFMARLFAAGTAGRSPLLERYYPPGLLVYPASHGFLGPQAACLQRGQPAACRLYVHDLATINLGRGAGNGATRNPFAR